jgi:hypothetical protein
VLSWQGGTRKKHPKYPLPPAFMHLCFQYFARKVFIARNLGSAASLCCSILCTIPAKVFYLNQLHAKYSEQNTYRVPKGCPILTLLLARLGICTVAGFQRSPPQPASRSRSQPHSEERAFAAPETDSSASHCILPVCVGPRRKRIPQNEGNHTLRGSFLRASRSLWTWPT